ncbi:MAG TPA: glycoside hydrolase family 16 protein, partial [Cytophagaceae bacterium]|nr:glycoside hydrolase family 16 protein [Cytophagaceae bacterium]
MKKTTIILTYLLFLLSPVLVFPQCGALVWSDEFNGATIDGTKWNVITGNGCPSLCQWGTGEIETYTNSTNNVNVAGGFLTLEARNSGGNYTSGRVSSNGKFNFKYGRLEMRAKLPVGTGLWPAFWMLPDMASPSWPNTGEIDIMENRGDQPYSISSTLHYGNPSPGQYDGSTNTLTAAQGKFSDNFHTFAVDWKAGQIDFYVDGILYKTETKTPNTLSGCCTGNAWPWDNNPFYIILNLAVGGTGTSFTGNLATNFGLSAQYIIDYVRVYSSAQPQLLITGKAKV